MQQPTQQHAEQVPAALQRKRSRCWPKEENTSQAARSRERRRDDHVQPTLHSNPMRCSFLMRAAVMRLVHSGYITSRHLFVLTWTMYDVTIAISEVSSVPETSAELGRRCGGGGSYLAIGMRVAAPSEALSCRRSFSRTAAVASSVVWCLGVCVWWSEPCGACSCTRVLGVPVGILLASHIDWRS